MLVKKVARTTNLTVGRITAINATVDVGYGGGQVARFTDQIVTTNISAGGDSDSLVVTLDNIAVGLLFAGSSAAAGRSGGTNLIRRRIREGWTHGTGASTRWNRG